MNQRQKNRALKGKRLAVKEHNLGPKIAQGLTQGMTADDIQRENLFPANKPDGLRALAHMARNERVGSVPLPRFVGEDDVDSRTATQFPDGRVFRDKELTFQPETLRAMRAGMICLKCLEPQPWAFADEHLPGCEGVSLAGPTYMKDRQILDIAMEFEGDKHLGPQKPLSEFADEQSLRVEKRKFIKRVLDGGQGRIPKEWLRDATLLDGLTPEDRYAIGVR